ncbi:MAG TPA: hypothetical protein DEG43_04600 [Acidimicrobiaceae bacterium]|nr:hypothetical protein [Acidimicrobiaceae bacterium]
MRIRGGAILIAFLLWAGSACSPSATALRSSTTYRVPATFADGLLVAIADLYGSPAGANHWDCVPSEAHPRPVILLHGILGNMADNLSGLSPMLANEGYCVFALNYGGDPLSIFGGVIDIRESAIKQFGPFVDSVLAATKAEQVDIVGHSEGSVMPRYWMRYGSSVASNGSPKVGHMIGVAPASQGALDAELAERLRTNEPFKSVQKALAENGCGACLQLMNGSEFMTSINGAGPFPGERFSGPAQPGVSYMMLATTWDNFVVPYRAGFIDHPQFKNQTVQQSCLIDHADHLSIVFDPVAYDLILNELDLDNPRPVRCVATEPAFTSVEQP